MTTILFIFALLTTPTDKYICDLWTRAITREGVIEACGITLLEGLRVDAYDLDMNPVCQMDAVYLSDIEEMMTICAMEKPLDEYVLRIVKPGWNELLCNIESVHEDAPSAEEIAAQCPQAKSGEYDIVFYGAKPPEITHEPFSCPVRNLPIGFGLYDQVPSADALLTDDSLTWLAGKLIWGGVIKPQCGGSGLDPYTLAADPCGMAFARTHVIRWQNQFNQDIYNSAVAYNVPAKLLKRMMMTESQFWPYYTAPAGEVGVMQVTDNGLDTLLRFDPELDPFYFERNDQQRFWSRSITRNQLYCLNCGLEEAIAHIKLNMNTYARLLAAFHCRAVTINPALSGNDDWRQAVVDYNGSAEYLARIEQ